MMIPRSRMTATFISAAICLGCVSSGLGQGQDSCAVKGCEGGNAYHFEDQCQCDALCVDFDGADGCCADYDQICGVTTTTSVPPTTDTPFSTTTCADDPCGTNAASCTDISVDAPSCNTQCATHVSNCEANTGCASKSDCLLLLQQIGGCTDVACVTGCGGNGLGVTSATLLERAATCFVDDCVLTIPDVTCSCNLGFSGPRCEVAVSTSSTTTVVTTIASTIVPTTIASTTPTLVLTTTAALECTSNPCQNNGVCTDETTDAPSCDVQCADELAACDANNVCGSSEVQSCLDSTRVPGGCEDSNCVISCATPFFNGDQATVIQAQLALQSSANCLIDGCKATLQVGVKCACDSDWTGDFCDIEVGAPTVTPTTNTPTSSPSITPSTPPTRTLSCAELFEDETFVDSLASCKDASDEACRTPQTQFMCRVRCSGCTTPPTTSPTTSAPTPSTATPTPPPTSTPSAAPSPSPTPLPSATPTTAAPTPLPKAPSTTPTSLPTTRPTPAPTHSPTTPAPTVPPTNAPIAAPSVKPSAQPTPMPSPSPTALPTKLPSPSPTSTPTIPLATCADDPPPCGKPENCVDINITAPPCSEQCSEQRGACAALPLCSSYVQCVTLDFINTYDEALFCGVGLTDATAVTAFEAMASCEFLQCVSDLPNGIECLSDPPTNPPTSNPSGAPSHTPTAQPSSHPTRTPTARPTTPPTPSPSSPPTASPVGVTTQPPVPLCNGVEDPPYCAAFDVSECDGIVGCPALCDTCSLSPSSSPVTLSPTLSPTAAPLYRCNGVDDAVTCGRFTQSQCVALALGGICPGMCGCTSKPTAAPTTPSPTPTPTNPPVAVCNGEPDSQICAQFSTPQCTNQPELQLNKFCPALCGRCTTRPTITPSTSMPTPAPSSAPITLCNGLPDPPICFARSVGECVSQGLDPICPALCNTCTAFPSAAPSVPPTISTTLPPSSSQPTTAPSLSTASPTTSKPTTTPLGNCGGVLDRSLCLFFVSSDCVQHDLHTSCPAMCGVCPTTQAPSSSTSTTTATPTPSTTDGITTTSATVDIGANETTLTTASPVATTIVTATQTISSTITSPPSTLATTTTQTPTNSPTATPTSLPTPSPTVSTTITTTPVPSASTTLTPTRSPSATNAPTSTPSTSVPTHIPSSTPTHVPTDFPSQTPSASPTTSPSENISWTLVVNPTPTPTVASIDAANGVDFKRGDNMDIMIAMIIVVVVLFVAFIVLTAVWHHYKHKEKADHIAERNAIVQPLELDPIVMTGSRSNAQHGQDATLEMITRGVTVDAPHLYGSQRNQANPMFHTSQPEVEVTPSPRPLFGGLSGLESLSRWAQNSNTCGDTAAGTRFTVWGNVDNVDLHKGVKELSKLLRTAAILPTPNNNDKKDDVSFIVRYLGNSTLEAEQGLEMVLGSTELFDMCQTLEQGTHGDSGKFKLVVRDGELQLRVHGTIRRKRGMDYKASQSNIDVSTFVSCFLYQQAVCLLVRKQGNDTSFVLHMYSCKDNSKSAKLQMYLSGMCDDSTSSSQTVSRIDSPLTHHSRRFDSPATVNSDVATDGATTPMKYLDVKPTANTPSPSPGHDDFAMVSNVLLSSTQRQGEQEDPNTQQQQQQQQQQQPQGAVSHELMRAKTPENGDDDGVEVAQMPRSDLPGMIPSTSPEKSRHGYDGAADDGDDDDREQYGVVSKFQHDDSESPHGGGRYNYKQTHVHSSSVPTTPYGDDGGGGGDDDEYGAIVNADHRQHEESYEDGYDYTNQGEEYDNDEENGYLDYSYEQGSSPEYDTDGKLIEVVALAKVEPSVHVEDVNRRTWDYRRPSLDSSLVSKNDSTTSA